jgi:hypothetical protein
MGALAMIPFKDWIYGGVIVALLAGFGWYTVHERNLGAAHEVAALQASSEKIQQETDKKTTALKTRADMAERSYEKEHLSVSSLPPMQPVRVCNFQTNRDRVVPKATSANAGNDVVRAAPTGLQQVSAGNTIVAGPDIGGMLDALAASADQVSATLREFQGRASFQ